MMMMMQYSLYIFFNSVVHYFYLMALCKMKWLPSINKAFIIIINNTNRSKQQEHPIGDSDVKIYMTLCKSSIL